jgi:polyhydroxyalkanoate synthesis regulator phasin
MAQKYELTDLWPKFEWVMAGDITSPEGLSAVFVLVLLAVVTFFTFISLWNYFKALLQLRFYRSLLKDVAADELLDKQREITNKAIQNKRYGPLWREFDESLVNVPHRERLFNTLDAAHFFNSHSISRGLTESRLLAAVPGFLTAIGVIGTFAGLQMGLAMLSGSFESAPGMTTSPNIDQLKNGIFGMIGGASIAFMTSVWGVFTSVVFNFFEKMLERSIRTSIATFQNQVDYLYPRITAEQSLSNIEDFSRQSTEKLGELDEKIGHRLQEAMREASDAIRQGMEESLSTILGPAIEKLVDNAHSGSEKALESLMGRYLDGIGSAGVAQKEMMEKAALGVQEASNSMANGMSEFMSSLESQMAEMVEKSSSTMTEVQDTLLSQMNEQQDRDVARQSVLNSQIRSFQGSQEQLSDGLSEMMTTQKQQNTELNQELSALVGKFGELSAAHERATQAMQGSAGEMKTTSVQMALMSTNIKEASDKLSENVSTSMRVLDEVSQRSGSTAEVFTSLIERMENVSSQIDSTSQAMNKAADTAQNGMTVVGQHFDKLGVSLKTHVEELEQQVATLLEDYSGRVHSQTNNRMDEWNTQTNKYIGSMTDAVRAINDVVDEMDGKLK